MRRPRRMSKFRSRRSFRKGFKVRRKNRPRRIMRGGIRL